MRAIVILLTVTVAALAAADPYAAGSHGVSDVAPFGLLDTIKTTVEDLLESGVSIKEKLVRATLKLV